jgi:NitT/TauT family transport system ATP-binding protein
MIEEIAAEPYLGRADLPALADSLQMEVDELFPVAVPDIGLQRRRSMCAKGFSASIFSLTCLAARIKLVLDERPSHTARAVRFFEELEDYMSEDYADQERGKPGPLRRTLRL